MADFKLTKQERQEIVDWLNGQSGDGDYYVIREDETTHIKRQTVNIVGSKWKVRIAFTVEGGYPVAMGAPILNGKQGKTRNKPGMASAVKAGIEKPKPKPAGLLYPGPKWAWAMKDASAELIIVDDQAPVQYVANPPAVQEALKKHNLLYAKAKVAAGTFNKPDPACCTSDCQCPSGVGPS